MPSELWKISLVKLKTRENALLLKIKTWNGKTPMSRYVAREEKVRFRLYTLQLTGQSLTFVTQVTHCYFCVVATSDNSFWPFSPAIFNYIATSVWYILLSWTSLSCQICCLNSFLHTWIKHEWMFDSYRLRTVIDSNFLIKTLSIYTPCTFWSSANGQDNTITKNVALTFSKAFSSWVVKQTFSAINV